MNILNLHLHLITLIITLGLSCQSELCATQPVFTEHSSTSQDSDTQRERSCKRSRSESPDHDQSLRNATTLPMGVWTEGKSVPSSEGLVNRPSELNEDRYCIGCCHNYLFAGVFDGHGSSPKNNTISTIASEFLYDHLCSNLMTLSNDENITREILAAFENLETEVITTQKIVGQGSTASIALIDETKIVLAYVGDSRIIAVKKDGTVGYTTNDHNHKNSAERARVIGGDGHFKGPYLNGQIAVTRSIGDIYDGLKIHGLLAIPEICIIPRDPEFSHIILASDGLWDITPSNENVAQFVFEQKSLHPHDIAQSLVKKFKLTDQFRHDDTTVVVVHLS